MLFLFFSALWAQVDFLNLLMPTTTSTACQTTLVFSTLSDQLARVAMEQFLIWSTGNRSKVTMEQLIMQAILSMRFIAGCLLVGFTRAEFAPVCIARTSLLPVAIVVIAFDFIIIGVLIIRVLSYGLLRDFGKVRLSTFQGQSRALVLCIIGFLVWTGVGASIYCQCGGQWLTNVSRPVL